jgi:hypothetical protein
MFADCGVPSSWINKSLNQLAGIYHLARACRCYDGPETVANAIGYAEHYSHSLMCDSLFTMTLAT